MIFFFFLETHHQLVVEFHSTNTLINSKFQYPPGNPQAFDRRPCWGGRGGEGGTDRYTLRDCGSELEPEVSSLSSNI